MILTKITSSMEKCFLDSNIADYPELTHLSALKNERVSFQLLYTDDANDSTLPYRATNHRLQMEGIDKELWSMRHVNSVPVTVPCLAEGGDGNFLRTTPGLYPDVLSPLQHGGLSVMRGQLQSVWIELDLCEKLPAGEHTITLRFVDGKGEILSQNTLTLTVIDALLPPQEMILTQWFHCDCLANYYNVDAWSEEHWRIVENFAATAARNGINMLLTPVHTPPLDTAMGRERKTVQLVDVTVENGKYSFGFDKLDRWIEMCNRVGIRYFEIAHLFTQWGAAHAPKIMATVDGEYKRIFGWDTDATSEEYTLYLRTFLTAFLAHMKARGDDKRCYFHMSDEPNKLHIDRYRAVKASVADILEGYPIMDALSNFEFYQDGLVKLPIPSNDHIAPFIEEGVPVLWTYYCCAQEKGVSNRFIAMPLWRTRSIGLQLYKFNIVGFLHWGYNFYNNSLSRNPINPYLDTCAGYSFPAGDAFS
ncbi:MAG: DUF4091 domain-containing protein, partial [Clostridia bacterium]|nr:DUF4091 domain-containing protein [Clostridia bacterium]